MQEPIICFTTEKYMLLDLIDVHGLHLEQEPVGRLLLDLRHSKVLHVVVEHRAAVQSTRKHFVKSAATRGN